MSAPAAPFTDHDQFFKTLFKTLLPELFQLFFPALSAELLLDQATFLDKEYFADFPMGEKRQMDILCRVPTVRQTYKTVLLQTENQEEDSAEPIDQRLFRYALVLQARHFPEPLVSALVQFATHEQPISVDVFRYEALGCGLSLKYYRCSVKSLDAEQYLEGDNPLGWALAVRMKRGRLSRVVLVIRCLAKLLRSQLSGLKKELLLNCVKTYMRLNPSEQAEMQAMLEQDEYKDVKRDEWTWAGQLRKEGRDEGLREGRDEGGREARLEDLREIYQGRFGQVPLALAQTLAQITDLGHLKGLLVTFAVRSQAEIAAELGLR